MTARSTSAPYRHAVVTAPGALEIRTSTSPPEPAPDGVVVAVTYCGVCATDTHAFTSGGLIPPAVFGHEWAGTVTAVGDDVTGLAVGDRVVAGVGPACGRCAQCRAGHTANCDTVFAEANGVTPDAPPHGGFATDLAVNARRVVPVLGGISEEQAALVEPTAVTFHAVKRARQPFGALVVVQGAGPIGLLTAQHARHAGAGVVLVVEPSPGRRATAQALGFTEVYEPGEEFVSRLREITDGLGADVVYECSGVAGLLQSSAELVRRGGMLALLGYPMTSSEVSYGDWQSRELTVLGSLAYHHEDFLGAMRSIASGAVRTEELHTGTVGLDDLSRLLTELDSGQSRHAKVLVDPRR
ncbi:(R,R)-butanediol dehydrogenase/meso-butanediol dehydrogenase/diacetyl reductase [Actinoalloteichus hoggarensis]|uniref:Sorbitol dehydrogenase n=1 Tax=Actinoalloteichus hoggarensis TaxID=1470176 RepID=A0A221W3W7_9PSEU|nr:zinc-binding dehydrogenase [Actinoalloteichus hoggarensis]ASO20373.1 Sorbitol dehydrogenase [Actinoalloteichus hoggarensis]MBB5923411.1 (R,R)-butanediol dehydrogenase/meso-butanediol dehydrogenase/diacetyl reductase [Actinoalloteichus hoggarensis]